VAWSGFHLWTGFAGLLPAMPQRAVHLGFALVLAFLLHGPRRGRARGRAGWTLDALLIAASLGATGYVALAHEAILVRAGSWEPFELALGGVAVALVLEATRRVLGWPLPVLALLALGYAAWGHLAPETIAHRGYPLRRILSTLYLTTDGLFGLILGVSASFVFLFVLFGACFRATGAAAFFLDLARAVCGGVRGGPAKVAIVGSSLFGMISGSTVANAGTVGTITIPLMTRSGFSPTFAAAVESAASVAGQLMPPVMGAAAFIMAEVLNVPYIQVAAAAALPAVLYYVALFATVDLAAARQGLRGEPAAARPRLGAVLRGGWPALLPVALLVALLAGPRYSPTLAAAWAIAALVAVSALRRATRPTPRALLGALRDGAVGALEVALACACVGILVGMVVLTGIGLKLSTILVGLAGGQLLVLLALTMLACLVLGTALPTTPTYVLLAVLVAPAIVQLGVPPIAAHLFVFYFGVIADITPPTALCVYVASQIAGAPFQRTCLVACRLALAGFLLPYAFVYVPALVLEGSAGAVVLAAASAGLGVLALAVALEGHWAGRLHWLERGLAAGAAGLLAAPGLWTDAVGLGLLLPVALRALRAASRAPDRAPGLAALVRAWTGWRGALRRRA